MPRSDAGAHPAPEDHAVMRRAPLAFGRGGFRIGSTVIPVYRGMGTISAFVFLGLVGAAGWVLGGHHDAMKSSHGSMRDITARSAGFPIRTVDVTGVKELTKEEILTASGLTPSASLLFVDVAQTRANVKALPLVAEATVRKLYPDRVNISIIEREPFALWQLEGNVSVVSADGTVIDNLSDTRYLKLPHVVGPGARLRVREYAGILDQVPELRSQIRAGVLVSERRWTLKLANGVDVKLPEENPVTALQKLAKLDRESQVLSKDIISVDLRNPGRVAFRLSEESAAARREDFAKRLPKIRGRA